MITTLLLLAAMGQAVPSDCNIATCLSATREPKCPKYEHIETFYSKEFILEDRCVPDIHVLYEKDWQDILERLKKLEDGKP